MPRKKKTKNSAGSGTRYNDEQRKKILDFLDKSGSFTRTTERFGVSYLTLRAWLKKTGKVVKTSRPAKISKVAGATKIKGRKANKANKTAPKKATGKKMGRPVGSKNKPKAGKVVKAAKVTKPADSPKAMKEIHALRSLMGGLTIRMEKLESKLETLRQYRSSVSPVSRVVSPVRDSAAYRTQPQTHTLPAPTASAPAVFPVSTASVAATTAPAPVAPPAPPAPPTAPMTPAPAPMDLANLADPDKDVVEGLLSEQAAS